MKFETLKDIEIKPRENSSTQFAPYVHTERLRQEAIKWMKAEHLISEEVIFWIEKFFNITESDLEEKDNGTQ